MLTVHLHVGAHRVYPRLFATMPRALTTALAKVGVRVVSSRQYQEVIEPALAMAYEAPGDDTTALAPLADIAPALGATVHDGVLAISRGSALGSPHEIISPGGLYVGAPHALLALDSLFADHAVVYHLTVCGIHDLLTGLRPNEVARATGHLQAPGAVLPSWHIALQRMTAALPDREFVVWDCDDRARMAPRFKLGLLGLDGDRTRVRGLDRLEAWLTASTDDDLAPTVDLDLPSHLGELLDAAYDVDLLQTATLPNVQVVTP